MQVDGVAEALQERKKAGISTSRRLLAKQVARVVRPTGDAGVFCGSEKRAGGGNSGFRAGNR